LIYPLLFRNTACQYFLHHIRLLKNLELGVRMLLGLGLLGVFAGAWALAVPQPAVMEAVVLVIPLIWLSVVDLDRFEIPELANVAVLLGGLVFSARPLWGVSLEVSIVLLAMLLFSILAEKWMGKTALGFGDVKLLGAGAAWVGALGVSSVILLASVAGIGFIVMMWRIGRRRFSAPLPFGPFIAAGLWATWLYGPVF
jgi:leader peptidase (prepilin peptidase)/N-methyltransferase